MLPSFSLPRLRLGLGMALLFALSGVLWRALLPLPATDPLATGPVTISSGALMALKLPDTGGQSHSFAEWQGHPMLINFWATWCLPCREELPLLRALARDPHFADARVIGVAVDEGSAVRAYLAGHAAGYPVLLEQDGVATQLAARLGNPDGALPFSAILDRRGDVVETRLGPWQAGELEQRLQKLLAAH